MAQIKTPEQIAAEAMLSVMEYVPLDDASMAHWTGALVAAIEADRAQRAHEDAIGRGVTL